jgi:class 3 adenylate cyclase
MTCASCGAELPGNARFCPACGAAVESRPAVAERKLATVLFGDLVGSTAQAAQADPERTRAVLERFYDAMAEEVTLAGGTIEKFAGDAVMAAFGAPAALEDHAERALHAALAMQRRVVELGGGLALRIGVNTGEVVVGSPREGSSFVSGDAVNVAARLEQAAAPGEILAGERTAAAVGAAFELDAPRTVEAKGKPDGVEARRVVRALSLMRPRGGTGLGSVFVGREHELELLDATYRRTVEQGEPHLVTIIGDTGVGKTRLVRELWETLARQVPEPFRRTGRCLPYGEGITYWPLGEIVKEQFGILEDDSPDRIAQRLGERGDLGLLLGLAARGVHPLEAREQLHEAWLGLVAELAAQRPTVLLVEDLHWAEDELLDLAERTMREASGPLLVIATARPELLDRRPGWGSRARNATLLRLEPLSASETERLAHELLALDLPPQVRDLVVARAEGNPFFVEEVLATLIDRGVLARENGAFAVRELEAELDMPDTVHAVVAARIDLLPPPDKAALQAAAVVGRVFWAGPVRALTAEEPQLELLEERDFVRRRAGSTMPGEREYAIKHAVIREVAYASLPKARRARMHAALAGWLEREGARDDRAPLVAHHYAEAVRPEDADLAWGDATDELERLRARAIEWLNRAGDLAIARYEIDDGIALLERALELVGDREAQVSLWHRIGKAYALKFDGPAFWDAMERAIALSEDRAETGALYADLAAHTVSRWGMWKRLPDRSLVDGYVSRALELAEPESEARATALVAFAMWQSSDDDARDRALAAATEARVITEQLDNADLRGFSLAASSFVSLAHGRTDDALAFSEQASALMGDMTDPDLISDVLQTWSLAGLALGRFGESRPLTAQFDELNSRLTSHHRVHGVAVRAELEELAGDWQAIGALQERVEPLVEANVDTPCVRNARTLLLCAVAHVQAGDEREAQRLEERAHELWMEGHGLVLETPRIRLALMRGDLARVEEIVARGWPYRPISTFSLQAWSTWLDALAALRDRGAVERDAPRVLAPNTYGEPFGLRALGIVREDDALVRQALDRFEAMGLGWHAAETRKLL